MESKGESMGIGTCLEPGVEMFTTYSIPGVPIGSRVKVMAIRAQRKVRGAERAPARVEFDFAGTRYFVDADAGALALEASL